MVKRHAVNVINDRISSLYEGYLQANSSVSLSGNLFYREIRFLLYICSFVVTIANLSAKCCTHSTLAD